MRVFMNLSIWVFRVGSSATTGAVLGALFGPIGASIMGLLGAVLGAVHAWALVSTGCLPATLRSWLVLLIDNTWALPNTILASLYLLANLLNGNPLERERCTGRSSLVLENGVMTGFATTIGAVEAGTNDYNAEHEMVHVLQARIFGPLFYPLVGIGFVIATVMPFWLLYHDHGARPIASVRDYFMNGVYPHAWHEEWAYRVA